MFIVNFTLYHNHIFIEMKFVGAEGAIVAVDPALIGTAP